MSEATYVGVLEVKKDYEIREIGETASNYMVYRVKKGVYPVRVVWTNGRRYLRATMNASVMESYYVNRLMGQTSVDHKHFEDGERKAKKEWSWGYHDSSKYTAPPMEITGNMRLVMNGEWIITADYRGNYDDGRPMIRYDFAEKG